MDSRERHELKENELAEFLTHFGEWWAKYRNVLLLTVAVTALIIVAGWQLRERARAQHEAAWGSLAGTSEPASYVDVAASQDYQAVRVLALLRGADAYRQQALSPQASEQSQLTAEQALDEAKRLYEQVLAAADTPVYEANARLGLAAVLESQTDWDGAAKQYDQVVQIASASQLPDLATQAEHRKGLLSQLQRPIIFAPEPEQPATAPAEDSSAAQPASTESAAPADTTADEPAQADETSAPAASND